MADNLAAQCQALLAALQALGTNHQTSHWQASGPAAFQLHLMFERLYGGIGDEVDGLAEKLVNKFDNPIVDMVAVEEKKLAILKQFAGEQDPVGRAVEMEEALQTTIKSVYEALKSAGKLSLGLDNFLQGIADSHETALYLLQQHLR